MTSTYTTDQLVALVRAYAEKPEHYERGWDVVVEAMDNAEIAAEIGNASTLLGAVRKLAPGINTRHDVMREHMAEARAGSDGPADEPAVARTSHCPVCEHEFPTPRPVKGDDVSLCRSAAACAKRFAALAA